MLVILESPFAASSLHSEEEHIQYARAALRDSLLRGESPIASHLLYTQPGVLNDAIPAERECGINAGLAWGKVAEKTVVYIDYGISKGMNYGIENAKAANRNIEYRSIFQKPLDN